MKIPNKRKLQQIASNYLPDTDSKDFMKLYKDYTKEPYSFLVNKTKNKRGRTGSNLIYNNYFAFYKYHNIKECTTRSLDSKLNHLKELKDKLKLFYYDTTEINPNNEDQIKGLEKRKAVLDTAL